jgi:hypothetical protein
MGLPSPAAKRVFRLQPDWRTLGLTFMKKALSKAEIVRRIERASEVEALFPLAFVPDPVQIAAQVGLKDRLYGHHTVLSLMF